MTRRARRIWNRCSWGRSRGLVLLAALVLALPCTAKRLRYAIVQGRDGWYRAIDETGRVLADSLHTVGWFAYHFGDEGLFPCVRHGRLGFKNYHNQVVVPPSYRLPLESGLRTALGCKGDSLLPARFSHGRAVVLSPQGQRFGLIDARGQLLADTVYDYIGPEAPGGARPARRGDRMALLDRNGRNILPPLYACDSVLYPAPTFGDGLLAVLVRVPPPPRAESRVVDGSGDCREATGAAAAHTYKVGFVDRRGRLVLDTAYLLEPPMLGNTCDESRRLGVGNYETRRHGERIPPPVDPYHLRDRDYYRFAGGRCLVSRGRGVFAINTAGDSLYPVWPARPVSALAARELYSGMMFRNIRGSFLVGSVDIAVSAGFRILGSATLVNREGRSTAPFSNSGIQEGDDGFFRVSHGVDSGCSFIDAAGNPRFGGRRYWRAEPFAGGFAHVTLSRDAEAAAAEVGTPEAADRGTGVIDTAGRFWSAYNGLILGRSEGLTVMGEGHIVVNEQGWARSNSFYGMRDDLGHWVIPPDYRQLRPLRAGRAAYAESGHWGYLNRWGVPVIPAQFVQADDFRETDVAD